MAYGRSLFRLLRWFHLHHPVVFGFPSLIPFMRASAKISETWIAPVVLSRYSAHPVRPVGHVPIPKQPVKQHLPFG